VGSMKFKFKNFDGVNFFTVKASAREAEVDQQQQQPQQQQQQQGK